MKLEIYSHKNAENLIDKNIKDDVIQLVSAVKFTIQEGCTLQLRTTIMSKLKGIGWSDDFKLDADSQITLTSSNADHALCFQTGNMSRFYADMLKLQYAFKKGKAKAAIYVIPSKEAAKKMGSNIAHFERFCFEITLFKDIITIPTLVVGIQ
jgi:hypothetical protein